MTDQAAIRTEQQPGSKLLHVQMDYQATVMQVILINILLIYITASNSFCSSRELYLILDTNVSFMNDELRIYVHNQFLRTWKC